jgi:DNA-binding NarL/FixJ family response regulator
MTAARTISIVVIQEHRVLREAVESRLATEPDLDVIACVATIAEAASALALFPTSVVVLDQPNVAPSCRSLMGELFTLSPTARAVILLHSTDAVTVSGAVVAGIAGVLCNDTPSDALVQAIRTVAAGSCVLDEQALRQLAAPWQTAGQPLLSVREREVLHLLADGSSNAQIANQLYVSTETVKTHVAHVLRKLEVPNRGSAVEKAARLGLLV